ncbi:RagB/SusD family nutrient uptake outer membrane protein [Pedobacter helvus]|uniref:RagB/SusD family nutrient uptake outer membrane protein n=1 Tax=Pedobacter helvus TaxID=2563444 RepID=A0ABW9JJI2_9SPHI|nr:RagB/SusD family nutrient uptake outer membrane protein [Pedobacter ureilyticus]
MVLLLAACSKSNFLDKKPSMDIVVAKTLTDFNNLLENTTIIRRTGSLAQMSADDYIIPDFAVWQGLSNNMQRNSYIWAKDIYGGDNGILDWNALYTSVFYANAVLDGLESAAEKSTAQGQYLKGWALFVRAYAFYDLTRNFCKAYDAGTAATDLGIPLRSTSAIEHIAQRATLQESYDRILGDLKLAETLLPAERPSANLNRPSKIAVDALMARIYLDMRNYSLAETYADKCLGRYSTLIDYNTVSPTAAVPFSTTNDELIYNTHQIPYNAEITGALPSLAAKISPELLGLYDKDDLRLPIYFAFTAATNSYSIKSGYYGAGLYPFTGLATDEVYLIKAECLARRNEPDLAMERLNSLLIRRFPNTAAKPYQPLVATSSLDALDKILLERRKELVWRGIRWHDLKRLNKEGANITLSRTLNGVVYTLPPNDPRWVFPIPDEEISESGIRQNIR